MRRYVITSLEIQNLTSTHSFVWGCGFTPPPLAICLQLFTRIFVAPGTYGILGIESRGCVRACAAVCICICGCVRTYALVHNKNQNWKMLHQSFFFPAHNYHNKDYTTEELVNSNVNKVQELLLQYQCHES